MCSRLLLLCDSHFFSSGRPSITDLKRVMLLKRQNQAVCRLLFFGDDATQSDKRVQMGGERRTGWMPVTQDRPVDYTVSFLGASNHCVMTLWVEDWVIV